MFDHVFYNDNRLKVLRILEITQEQDLAPGRAGDVNQKGNMVCYLPNSVFPSNHLRLEVEFELSNKKVKWDKETA